VQVILVRHAEAVPETVEVRGPSRSLTVIGRTQARALGERMRWHDCDPTQLWTSPLVRAVQTAELIAASLHCELPVDTVPALAPDGSPRDVLAALRGLPAEAVVVVVGHEPSLSALGALLADQPTLAGLARAEAVRIVDGVVRWRLAWDAEAPSR